jgi:hypothetical protein
VVDMLRADGAGCDRGRRGGPVQVRAEMRGSPWLFYLAFFSEGFTGSKVLCPPSEHGLVRIGYVGGPLVWIHGFESVSFAVRDGLAAIDRTLGQHSWSSLSGV